MQAISRHVLFHEYNRRPLRREDITKTSKHLVWSGRAGRLSRLTRLDASRVARATFPTRASLPSHAQVLTAPLCR